LGPSRSAASGATATPRKPGQESQGRGGGPPTSGFGRKLSGSLLRAPTQVFHYLGRYTHRVGLSNDRLQAISPAAVRFATKDGRSVTVSPHEFLRRFLLHVLPAGFVKIRHFGLFGARQVPTALAHARRLLAGAAPPIIPGLPSDWRALLHRLTGVDLARCPRCAHGTMLRHLLPSGAPVYAPP